MRPNRDLMQNLIEKRYNGKILQYALNHIDIPIGYDVYVFRLFQRTLRLPKILDGSTNGVDYIKSLEFNINEDPEVSLTEIMDCVDEELEIADKLFDFILRTECNFCWIFLYGNPYDSPKNWYELIKLGY